MSNIDFKGNLKKIRKAIPFLLEPHMLKFGEENSGKPIKWITCFSPISYEIGDCIVGVGVGTPQTIFWVLINLIQRNLKIKTRHTIMKFVVNF